MRSGIAHVRVKKNGRPEPSPRHPEFEPISPKLSALNPTPYIIYPTSQQLLASNPKFEPTPLKFKPNVHTWNSNLTNNPEQQTVRSATLFKLYNRNWTRLVQKPN